MSRRPLATAAVVLLALVVGAGAAFAGQQQFSDVSAEHPFAEDIEAIAGAGVTTGFDDGTFRPSAPVTRQSMAAFMARGFGRVQSETVSQGFNEPVAHDFGAAAILDVTSPATGGGGGFVTVAADLSLRVPNPAACPCLVRARIFDGRTEVAGPTTSVTVGEVANPPGSPEAVIGDGQVAISTSHTVELPADTSSAYIVQVDIVQTDSTAQAWAITGHASATYVPLPLTFVP